MNIKIYSVADRIRNGLLNANELKNLRNFAHSEGMILNSIPLKNGTTAKILSNSIEYDCLIMKNGKILTARGQIGTTDDIVNGVMEVFEHIQNRKRAVTNINVENESYKFFYDYLSKYKKLMTTI